MSVDLQLLDFDPKRLHYFMRMHRLPDEDLAATTEILLMHVDTRAGRGAGMPAAVLAAVEDLARTQAALPRPEEVGRPIGIRRR
jgi:acyl-CoA thioesterase FadM